MQFIRSGLILDYASVRSGTSISYWQRSGLSIPYSGEPIGLGTDLFGCSGIIMVARVYSRVLIDDWYGPIIGCSGITI